MKESIVKQLTQFTPQEIKSIADQAFAAKKQIIATRLQKNDDFKEIVELSEKMCEDGKFCIPVEVAFRLKVKVSVYPQWIVGETGLLEEPLDMVIGFADASIAVKTEDKTSRIAAEQVVDIIANTDDDDSGWYIWHDLFKKSKLFKDLKREYIKMYKKYAKKVETLAKKLDLSTEEIEDQIENM